MNANTRIIKRIPKRKICLESKNHIMEKTIEEQKSTCPVRRTAVRKTTETGEYCLYSICRDEYVRRPRSNETMLEKDIVTSLQYSLSALKLEGTNGTSLQGQVLRLVVSSLSFHWIRIRLLVWSFISDRLYQKAWFLCRSQNYRLSMQFGRRALIPKLQNKGPCRESEYCWVESSV